MAAVNPKKERFTLLTISTDLSLGKKLRWNLLTVAETGSYHSVWNMYRVSPWSEAKNKYRRQGRISIKKIIMLRSQIIVTGKNSTP